MSFTAANSSIVRPRLNYAEAVKMLREVSTIERLLAVPAEDPNARNERTELEDLRAIELHLMYAFADMLVTIRPLRNGRFEVLSAASGHAVQVPDG